MKMHAMFWDTAAYPVPASCKDDRFQRLLYGTGCAARSKDAWESLDRVIYSRSRTRSNKVLSRWAEMRSIAEPSR